MLAQRFGNQSVYGNNTELYQSENSAVQSTSVAIKQAVETAKSAVKLLACYEIPYTNKALGTVEAFLNRNCPGRFSDLAVRIFNQHSPFVVARQLTKSGKSIELNLVKPTVRESSSSCYQTFKALPISSEVLDFVSGAGQK